MSENQETLPIPGFYTQLTLDPYWVTSEENQ